MPDYLRNLFELKRNLVLFSLKPSQNKKTLIQKDPGIGVRRHNWSLNE